jgi:hypothetical protein
MSLCYILCCYCLKLVKTKWACKCTCTFLLCPVSPTAAALQEILALLYAATVACPLAFTVPTLLLCPASRSAAAAVVAIAGLGNMMLALLLLLPCRRSWACRMLHQLTTSGGWAA